jgi:hypothetical protein
MHEHIVVALNTMTQDLFGNSKKSLEVGDEGK